MEVATAPVWHLQRRLMEDLGGGGAERRLDVKRPLNLGQGFPLGTVLLFLVVGMSALLSCCFRWGKINNFYSRHASSNFADTSVAPNLCAAQTSSPPKNLGIQQEGRMLAVVMPGNQTPSFIAFPCPRLPEEM